MSDPRYVSRAIVDGVTSDGVIHGHYGATRPVGTPADMERYRRFLRLMGRLETRWVRTGDPQLKAIADDLYEWERESHDAS